MMNNGQNPYGNYYNPYYPVMPNQLPVNQIRPCPIPAYPACNPWAGSNCGCNSVCG